MIAFDPVFRAGDEFLRQQLELDAAQLRPQAPQRFGVFDVDGLPQSESCVPGLKPGQRLDDQRERKAKIGGLSGRGVETPSRRHRETVALRQELKASFVQQILDKLVRRQ